MPLDQPGLFSEEPTNGLNYLGNNKFQGLDNDFGGINQRAVSYATSVYQGLMTIWNQHPEYPLILGQELYENAAELATDILTLRREANLKIKPGLEMSLQSYASERPN